MRLALSFACHLPLICRSIPFRGSFLQPFCPFRLHASDSQSLDGCASCNSRRKHTLLLSSVPFTSVNPKRYRCPMSCPLVSLSTDRWFAVPLLRFVYQSSVTPPLLRHLSDAPAFFLRHSEGIAKDDRGRVGRLRYYFGMHVRICAKIHRG